MFPLTNAAQFPMRAARNKLVQNGKVLQTFDLEFTPLQRQVLRLLAVPEHAFVS